MAKVKGVLTNGRVIKLQLNRIGALTEPVKERMKEDWLVRIESKVFGNGGVRQKFAIELVLWCGTGKVGGTSGSGPRNARLQFVLLVEGAVRSVRKAHGVVPVAAIALVERVRFTDLQPNCGIHPFTFVKLEVAQVAFAKVNLDGKSLIGRRTYGRGRWRRAPATIGRSAGQGEKDRCCGESFDLADHSALLSYKKRGISEL
jgi:hypothetical protein